MTNEVSNKTLAALLVVAIVISLGGSLMALNKLEAGPTARAATTQGTASLNVQAQAIVNVTTTSVDFGNVTVASGDLSCTLDSSTGGVGTCDPSSTTGTSANGGFVFENIGNVNINVSVTAGKSAATFIGGTQDGGPAYNWKCATKLGTGTPVVSTYTGSSTSPVLCYGNMAYSTTPGENEAYLDIQVKVPSDATPGSKTDTITFTASQA